MLPLMVLVVVLGSGDDKVPVKGVTTVASTLCGGAPARPEVVAKAATPKLDPGAHLRLYRGRSAQGEALEVKSDAEGRFTLTLPAGDWCVVDGRRQILPGSKPIPGADVKCWASAALGCDAIWAIDRIDGKAPPELVLHYLSRCDWNPCGPQLPPRP